jgi:SAM-dependent methyltransferase
MKASPRNPFEQVYAQGGWSGVGSGPGSQFDYTRNYIVFLEEFLRYNGIRSVVDFGCGDWTFSQYVNWGDAAYLGIDCVASVIEKNKLQHARGNVQFKLVEYGELSFPPCDLLISKDVLQHLPFAAIHQLLAAIRANGTPFALLTNDFADVNVTDIQPNGYRPLNLSMPPFDLNGAVVFSFGWRPHDKVVFLLRN